MSGATSSSGNIGMAFAIPISEAKSIADRLIAGKTPSHAVLGVTVTDATGHGALVTAVTSGSPAANAGLRAGDVITAVDGTPVSDADSLTVAIRSHPSGSTVAITYRRDGATHTAQVTLTSQPNG